MKNLLIAVLTLSCTFGQAQIIRTIIHETGGNTAAYRLSSLDSIVYNTLHTHMTIYELGGNTVTYQIVNIDSVTYDTIAVVPVQCGAVFTDARDGEVYPIVQIGNQCWMAENLRYNAPGSSLNPANPSAAYGRLYDWATLMAGSASSGVNPSGVQGVCPSGWHIPSDAEWNEMELALGMPASGTTAIGYRGTHGVDMKSTTGWNSGGNGTNSLGFNAFPAGYHSVNTFLAQGIYSHMWSSTESSGGSAWTRSLYFTGTGGIRINYYSKANGFSCRCVKD